MSRKTLIFDGSTILGRGKRMLLGMANACDDEMAYGHAVVDALMMGNDRSRLASIVQRLVRRLPAGQMPTDQIETALHDDIRTAIDAVCFSADELKMMLNRANIDWQGKRLRFGGWIRADFYVLMED